MKNLRWIAFIFACLPLLLRAEAVPQKAKLIATSGSVVISLPGGGGSGATVGAELPVGTLITTGGGGQATVKFFDGTVAIVQSDSTVSIQTHDAEVQNGAVTKEDTLLDLRAGGVIASLDPAKKNVTNFRVRTPKGVAAARGTVFAVRVTQTTENASVTTMSGTVTFITDQGEISVAFGQVSSGNTAQTVAEAVKANPNLANEIVTAAAQVATAVGGGSVANTAQTPGLVTAVLTAVTDVAIQAAPARAPEIVKQVIVGAGPALQGSTGASTVAAVTESAQQAAAKADPVRGVELATAIAQASTQAASAAGVGSSPAPGIVLPPLDQTVVSPARK